MNKQWSKNITLKSHALTLEKGIFTWHEPKKIAESLLQSAENSQQRKGTSYQSAMSMLNFYINRAGTKLSSRQKAILNQAKQELRLLCDKHQNRRL